MKPPLLTDAVEKLCTMVFLVGEHQREEVRLGLDKRLLVHLKNFQNVFVSDRRSPGNPRHCQPLRHASP